MTSSRHVPGLVCPEGKFTKGYSGGIQNVGYPVMARYGRISPIRQGFLQFYYGGIWLTAVYRLWFTRERSKVRFLVRPPCFALRATHGAASQEIQGEACPA